MTMPTTTKQWLRLLALLTPFSLAQPALADGQHNYLEKRHFVYLGGYQQDGDLVAKSQRELQEPVTIEFEKLGVNDDFTSAMLDYHFRLNDRWSLSAAYYRFLDGGNVALSEDITWEGENFDAGLAVDIDWDIDTYIFDVMYSVAKSDTYEFAVGGGIHALDTSLTVTGQGTISGEAGELQGSGTRAKGSMLAPLPNLRGTGFYAFNDKWSVQGTVGWLSLGIDEYQGDFTYAHVRGQYQVTEKFGVSLGYQLVHVDVEQEIRLGFRRFDVDFRGVTAAITFAF